MKSLLILILIISAGLTWAKDGDGLSFEEVLSNSDQSISLDIKIVISKVNYHGSNEKGYVEGTLNIFDQKCDIIRGQNYFLISELASIGSPTLQYLIQAKCENGTVFRFTAMKVIKAGDEESALEDTTILNGELEEMNSLEILSLEKWQKLLVSKYNEDQFNTRLTFPLEDWRPYLRSYKVFDSNGNQVRWGRKVLTIRRFFRNFSAGILKAYINFLVNRG